MIQAQALVEKFHYALESGWGYIWGAAGTKWTAAKQKAATREQTIKYGKKWIGHMVADCSGLFKWAFKQLGGDIYHGSNTMYRKYCSAKGRLSGGQRTDGLELQPGTAVFTGTESDHGHVGLYVGSGKVIEAKGTQSGVIMSSVSEKKWTYWGELKDVEYGEPRPDAGKPTLRKGDKGQYVTLLQTQLANRGYDLGKYGVDGDFGSATEKAVKAFQQDSGLMVDGVVGKSTWEAFEQSTSTYTVVIPGVSKSVAADLVSQYTGATMTEELG